MKLRLCILLITLCLLSGDAAFAQFSDSVHYHLQYAATGVLNKTNDATSYLLTNTLRVNTRLRRLDANGAVNWLFGEQDRQLSNNDFNSTVDFNLRSRLPRLYYWGLGSFEKSYSLKVINRTQAGAGLAANIVDRGDSLSLNVSDGLLYEYSALQLSDSSESYYSTVRNSFRLRLRFRLWQRLSFESTSFIQHSLRDGSDYIIRSNSSLGISLRNWLSLTTALTYNKVTRTNSENLLLTFGLTVDGWL